MLFWLFSILAIPAPDLLQWLTEQDVDEGRDWAADEGGGGGGAFRIWEAQNYALLYIPYY